MEPVTLPEKLSDLLELAVRDAQECEKDPRYVLDMAMWHSPGLDGKCHVCLAGSVMAMTLNIGPGAGYSLPSFFADDTEVKLHALDALRCGVTQDALLPASLPASKVVEVDGLLRPIREAITGDIAHKRYGRAPWDVYLAVAQKLREAGF